MKDFSLKYLGFALLAAFIICPGTALAGRLQICKNDKGQISVKKKCRKKKGELALDVNSLVGPQGPAGPAGSAGQDGQTGNSGADGKDGADGKAGVNGKDGAAGTDGSLRIYGDGSDGSLEVTSGTKDIDDPNKQYTDITISAGAALRAFSGTVLRCTGTATINGTLEVHAFAFGSDTSKNTNTWVQAIQHSHPGITRNAAGIGEYGNGTVERAGGNGGYGLSDNSQAKAILKPGPAGGGGGGACVGSYAPPGGGTITILCKNKIQIGTTGIINVGGEAPGQPGNGGGGGGIVILASPGSVTNEGSIKAFGAFGGPSNSDCGSGGGGGGGFVHILSPAITNNGSVDVSGGNAGDDSVNVTGDPRSGGGGGGACFGHGGNGGAVPASNIASAAEAGEPGALLTTQTDPTGLF